MLRVVRVVFTLMVLTVTVHLAAQTPAFDAGAWYVSPRLTQTTLTSPLNHQTTYREHKGFGVSLNRFWAPWWSTELSAMRFSSDAAIESFSIEGERMFDNGSTEVTLISAMALLHFNADGHLSPYIGGGIVRAGGKFDSRATEPALGSFRYTPETTWGVNAGANLRITNHLSVAGDVKYVSWGATIDGTIRKLDLDPLTVSVGLRVRR